MIDYERQLACLTEKQLKDLYHRLSVFIWRHWGMIQGLTADELIADAIGDYLLHVRNEPTSNNVSLEKFLQDIIKSKLSHVFPRLKRRVPFADLADRIDPNSSWATKDHTVHHQIEMKELRERMLEIVNGDAILSGIVQSLFENPGIKPRTMAVDLGTTMDEMRNAQKRLHRILLKLEKEEEGWLN